MSDKNISVAEARERFVESVEAIDPMKVVRENPIIAVGLAISAGALLGFAGFKLVVGGLKLTNLPLRVIRKILF